MNTHTFYIHGIHCNSCSLLIEGKLSELPAVQQVTIAKNNTITITGTFDGISHAELLQLLNQPLQEYGYTISSEKQLQKNKWAEFRIALPITLGIALLFIGLQKIGLINLITTSTVTYGTAFLIGIIASLSSCMAVVGGLLLSLSATAAKKGETMRPQILFHSSRIISFFILGGIIGAIGSVATLSAIATFSLGSIITVVMLILGINLLDIAPWAKRLQPSLPKRFTKQISPLLSPILIGIATFFLPCGFTQSMQLYTLSTGSFITGGLTMFSFALGTLPVLVLISMSSFSIQKSPYAGVFFKSAGLIVILFALFNLINALASVGIISPVFTL